MSATRLLGYLRRLNVRLDPLAQAAEAHMHSLGEAMTGAALAPGELARRLAEGAMLRPAGRSSGWAAGVRFELVTKARAHHSAVGAGARGRGYSVAERRELID